MNLKYPLNYIAITEYYRSGVHNGLDLGWNYSYGGPNVDVYASYDGEVVDVRKDYNQTDTTGSSYGNYVRIRHINGFETLYAHLAYNTVTVNVGDIVKQGTKIGNMGATGRADGNHLHYEVFINGVKVNPIDYTYVYKGQITSSNPEATVGLLYLPDIDVPCKEEEELKKKIQELEDKLSLQTKEIESLKEELNNYSNIIFTYNVEKTSLYQIELYEGEELLIRNKS